MILSPPGYYQTIILQYQSHQGTVYTNGLTHKKTLNLCTNLNPE